MTLLPTHQGFNRIARSHPGPGGVGCSTFFPSFNLPWSRPPSLFLVAIRLGALDFSLPLLLLLFPLLLPPFLYCFLSCPTLFPTIYYTLTIWRQLVFFLPSLSHPSPLLNSVTVASQMFFLSLPAGGRVDLGWGDWGREGGTTPFSLGRFLPLLGFLPLCFGLTG